MLWSTLVILLILWLLGLLSGYTAVCEGRLTHMIGLSESRHAGAGRCLLAILVALTMFGPGVCLAGEPIAAGAPDLPLPALHLYQESIYHEFARSAGINYRESLSQIASDKGLAGELIATGTPEAPKPVLSWETGAGKIYLVPALEIPSFILLLNGFDRFAYPNEVEGGKKVYNTDPSTFWDHVVHGPW
ncbi:MAG: hypothetical protein ACXWMI_12970, partial [Syntrophales bacterium]